MDMFLGGAAFASKFLRHLQISVELTASYHYLTAASYFNRDDVALAGFHVCLKLCRHFLTLRFVVLCPLQRMVIW